MTYPSTAHVAPAAIVPGITRLLERVCIAALEGHRRSIARRQYRYLLDVEDHLLKDVDVSRDEVRATMYGL